MIARAPVPVDLASLSRSRPGQVPLTCALLAINLLLFVLMQADGAGFWHNSSSVPLAWGASFGPATQDGQWWRLVTAQFVHFGLLHLGLNMWALWDVGRLVERPYGPLRFGLLYLGSGLVGNLLSLAVQGNQAVSGGASGAIFGLYGALLVFLWRERGQVDRRDFSWAFGVAVIFTLTSLGLGWLIPGVDNAAHLGGLVAGACLGTLLARRWLPDSPAPLRERWLAAVALTSGIAALLTHLPAPLYLMGEERRAREAIQQFLVIDQQLSQRWNQLMTVRLGGPGHARVSFDQLASRIQTSITSVYDNSFKQLAAARPTTAAPSAKTLEALQNYAGLRAEASRELADGLRRQDQGKILAALEKARKAHTSARAPAASGPPAPDHNLR